MQKHNWLRLGCILTFCGSAWAQTLDGGGRFLVKLATDLGAKKSKAGDRVTAFVISPERFLAGTFEGTVDRAADGSLQFSFQSLKVKDKTFRVTSKVLSFVNSKGHPQVDERERPVQNVNGRLQSTAQDFTLDEGAEFSLEITPVKQ